MPRQSLLPAHERANLEMTVEDARELAEGSEASEGRDLLEGGLYRAEQLRDTGEVWGAELVARYQAALRSFTSGYESSG